MQQQILLFIFKGTHSSVMKENILSMSWLWRDGKWVPFGFTQALEVPLPHCTPSSGLQKLVP